MQEILQAYQRRLTNLSGNNRSLLLLRLNAEQFLDIHDFDHVNGAPSWDILDQVIANKSKIKLIPIADARDENSNQLSRRLKKLQRREQFIFQESGARDLYIGWPFVQGKFNDGTILRAPLCFFPVELVQDKINWVLCPKKDVNISFNKSLLLAFAHYNEIKLADELVEFTFDGYDKDSTTFKNMLYEQLRESAIDLRFSREFYADRLEPFTREQRQSFEKNNEDGEVHINMQAVLGIFPQADSYLVPDYNFLTEHIQAENLDSFFEQKSINLPDINSLDFDPTQHFLGQVNEKETFAPLPLDAYQENALTAIKKGNSIVVQGPPGTGKSQLICNLVSDFIARGKKVLVVSQKRAALDVVYQRLKSIEIEDFAALVHDFKADRKAIYEQIANQIESLHEYKRSNNNLDALQLDRAFTKACLEIDSISDELNEYKTALFNNSECGLSVKELYLSSDPDHDSVSLVQEYNDFHFDSIDNFKRKLDLYLDYAHELNSDKHPWSERVSFAKLKNDDLSKTLQYLDEIPSFASKVTQDISKIVNEKVDYDACRTISENLDKLKTLAGHLKNQDIFELFKPMVAFGTEESDLLWLQNTRNLINTCFEDNGVEHSISSSEIGEVQLILKQRSDAKNTFWKSIKWRFSKEKLRLARILVANNLRDDKAALQVLTSRIDNRLNLQHQLTKLKAVGWIESIPDSSEQSVINEWLDQLESALNAKTIFNSFANFKEFFPLKKISGKEFRTTLKSIAEALKELPKRRAQWNKFILPKQIDLLLNNDSFHTDLKKTLRRDFDTLRELDKLRISFSETEIQTIDKLLEHQQVDKTSIISLFDNSIRLAWIDHIENKYPILTAVSTLKFEKLIDQFQQHVTEKSEACTQILKQRAREGTYEGLEFNRLNNQVTYRDLLHQVTKKKRIWPLRRLITNFEHELFKLVPCWLASPESVSAIFPMEPFFDLVIFDEASQCFTEKGIPAIYRGRQVVIAGDSQQLKPNDLYRVRWDDEQEDNALEVDSLLDLAKNHLMQVSLQGHYRSQSLSLVEFSNQHFYKGKLRVLPDFSRINNPEPAIEYIKVQGVWENQSNLIEANRITKLVKDLNQENPSQNIGVVTFNAQQQTLVLDKIEGENLKESSIQFIKNIENVQGDECDVLIFSIGYAPDAKGKLTAQFGSLNQVGGENRLNVAITRAREKVIIVSSILPDELKVDKAKNEGPKLLKQYLQYAFEVANHKFKPTPQSDVDFSQDWYLKNQLKPWEADLTVSLDSSTPFGDVALKSERKHLGLLFTDDNYFYSSISMKEVCVYRPIHLQEKHWPYRLIHSREFWINKDKVKDKLVRFIEQID